ncbi:unnamed protein product, partial [Mesorhabditis spiculigera]
MGTLLDERGLTKGRGVLVSSFKSRQSSASAMSTRTSYEEEQRYRCEESIVGTKRKGPTELDKPLIHYHYVAGSLECFHSITRTNSKKRRHPRKEERSVAVSKLPSHSSFHDRDLHISHDPSLHDIDPDDASDEEFSEMSWRDYPGTPEVPRRLGGGHHNGFSTPQPPTRDHSLIASASRQSLLVREENRRYLHSPASSHRAYDELHRFSSSGDIQKRLSSFSLHSIAGLRH